MGEIIQLLLATILLLFAATVVLWARSSGIFTEKEFMIWLVSVPTSLSVALFSEVISNALSREQD